MLWYTGPGEKRAGSVPLSLPPLPLSICLSHVVSVVCNGAQAQVKRGQAVAAEYLLDVLGEKPPLSLPTQDRKQGGSPTQVPLTPFQIERG